MRVDVKLELRERSEDRVRVHLILEPACVEQVHIEGTALQLVDAEGEPLCPRSLLPVSGALSGVVSLSAELRCDGPLPPGARVLAMIWIDGEPTQVTIPADPFTLPAQHVRGDRMRVPDLDDVELRVLDEEERADMVRMLPWTAEVARTVERNPVLEAREGPSKEDLEAELGLDPEDAAWLEALLDDDDELSA